MTKNMRNALIVIPAAAVVLLAVGCSGAGGGGLPVASTQADTPVISPESGEITNTTAVTISAEEGAVIYYTLDGSDPTSASTEYTEPLTLPADVVSQTVKAVAVLDGLDDSDVAAADYLVEEGVAPVAFADASGALPDNADIALSTATAGATIYYTTDGEEPTAESNVYSAPFTMASLGVDSVTVKAFAVLDGYADSDVASAEYTKAVAEMPVSDRADGSTISDAMTVTLSTGTVGAEIYYTTNGDEPTAASASYTSTGPFTLPAGSAVVKAVAVLDGYVDSDVVTVNLAVEAQAEVPTISEASGFLAAGSAVTLSTGGSETIYYTVDGSDPAVSGIEYTGAVTIDEATTLRAYASGDGYYPSAEATADYAVYESIAGLGADASALAAIASDGSVAVRAGGSYYDLISGTFSARSLAAAEPAGDVLDFALDDSGVISALYLVGTDVVYWTSAGGTVATVNTAAVTLADARILIDSTGNARIVFTQYADAVADELVETVYDENGASIRASAYSLDTRAIGLDVVLDSSGTLSIAAAQVKNTTSAETAVVAWDEDASDWNLVMGWTNNASAPALVVRSDDSLLLGHVWTNKTKTRFIVHDIDAAVDLITINDFDTATDGDSNLALDSDGNIYAASNGYGWRIADGSETALTMGAAPYRVLSDPSGAVEIYIVATANLDLYSIK